MRSITQTIIVACLSIAPIAKAAANDTSLTYQGELKQNGGLANGTFDMDFSLWDAASAGTQVRSTISLANVPVSDGRFSVELDFGSDAFNNEDRWLQIEVERSVLLPRQPITRSPYSIQTRGIFVDADQNVGIGTDAPSVRLHIDGGTDVSPAGGGYVVAGDMGSRNIAVDDNEIMARDNGVATTLHINPQGGDVVMNGAGNGRLGIGSSSPSARLEVVADTASQFDNTARFEAPLIGGRASHIHHGTLGNWYIRSAHPDGDVIIQDSGGNVGIGTNNPQAPLHVQHDGGTAAISGIAPNGTGVFGNAETGVYGFSSAHAAYGVRGQATGTGSHGVHGAASGFGGIGVYGETSDDTGRAILGLALAQTGTATGVQGWTQQTSGRGVYGRADLSSGTNYGVYGVSTSSNGYDFFAAGAGINYGSSSSIRWKHNVQAIERPLEKVKRLRGVTFDWDEEHGGHHDIGLIAEEVGAVLPEIVTYEENGVDAVGMDYSKLTPLLIEAFNALRAEMNSEIADLRAENEELRSRLDSLEQIVARLARTEDETK